MFKYSSAPCIDFRSSSLQYPLIWYPDPQIPAKTETPNCVPLLLSQATPLSSGFRCPALLFRNSFQAENQRDYGTHLVQFLSHNSHYSVLPVVQQLKMVISYILSSFVIIILITQLSLVSRYFNARSFWLPSSLKKSLLHYMDFLHKKYYPSNYTLVNFFEIHEKQIPINFCDGRLKIHKAQVVFWRLTAFINSKCSPSPEISKNSDLVRMFLYLSQMTPSTDIIQQKIQTCTWHLILFLMETCIQTF